MGTDKLSLLFKRFYILIFAFAFSLYTGLAFLAPVLMHYDLIRPGKLIYEVVGFFCPPLPCLSFFRCGQQAC